MAGTASPPPPIFPSMRSTLTDALPAALMPRQPEEMSRGLRWSLIAHAVVFGAALVKALVFPGEPVRFIPALRVDIVGLPDILKKDLSKIPKTQAADNSSESQKKPTEAIKPIVPPPSTMPKKAVSPPKEEAEPDQMVLKPTAPQQKAREKKLKSALDRIKALERINEDVQADKKHPAAPAGMVVKGNKVSKGTSLSPDAKESAEASYFDSVRDRLQSNWALPVWLARQNLDAQILIQIDSAGRVTGLKFMKASGNAQFDDAVRKTVQASQPFSPPPSAILDSIGLRGVLVGFPL